MASTCTHLDQIRSVTARTPDGCEECLQTGDRWVHLRLCLTCGHVGCCDASPNRHATGHWTATGHPIVQSYEPNEDWAWCYVDQVILEPTEVELALAAPVTAASTDHHGDASERTAGRPGGMLSRVLGFSRRRNYVVGAIDDEGAARHAVDALQRGGFTPDGVVLQTGSEISERLQRRDLGSLVREAVTEEGSICRDYDELSHGSAIVSVYTTTDEDVEKARRIMAENGAHSLKHFGDWTITDLSVGSGAG
jgi:hypothetical protein